MNKRRAEEGVEIETLYQCLRLREDGRLINRLGYKEVRKPKGAVMDFASGPGYRAVLVDGRRIMSHRVVFAMVHGRWPQGDVDHINGIPDDNRPENLRECSRSENLCNRTKLHPANKSGVTGVFRIKASGRWRAAITKNGVTHNLGDFVSMEDAIEARLAAENQHMGEFSPKTNKR